MYAQYCVCIKIGGMVSLNKMMRLIMLLLVIKLMSCGQTQTKSDDTSVKENSNKGDTTIFTGADNSSSEKDFVTDNEKYNYVEESLNYQFKNYELIELTDTINEDLNGDGLTEKAIYKTENGKSGIIIIDGKTKKELKIGFGSLFAHLDNFDWVDYWGIVRDTTTFEIIIENGEIIGDKPVRLENPSIVIGEEEYGGGLITYLKGKYQWIHQTE